ncbi:MAG: hypothetical protein J6K88_06650 [Oscillospiraceae bacterium]|nr:hypothetical protein [Oscillospiraceae bacterium]
MNRILNINEEIKLNQFVQNIFTLEEMEAWFLNYNVEDRRSILFALLNMVIQSGATTNDISVAANNIKKGRATPTIMLLNQKEPFQKFGYKICRLPENELANGFKVLLCTLAISDNRRKEDEKGICNHWWHKDLSDEKVLETIKKNYM